jgi:hypothetical protein
MFADAFVTLTMEISTAKMSSSPIGIKALAVANAI